VYSLVYLTLINKFYTDGERELLLIKFDDNKTPTYQEIVDFLLEDKTDMLRYIPEVFMCSDFNAMVHNRAQYAGLECKLGFIKDFDKECGHACVVWDTSDYGRIYTDSTGEIDPDYTIKSYDSLLQNIKYGEIGKFREFETGFSGDFEFITGNIEIY
jgi:hypothetical protein